MESDDGAIDLSIKSKKSQLQPPPIPSVLFKPIPRPAWSIFWYQTIWPTIPINNRDQENQAKFNSNQQNQIRQRSTFTNIPNPISQNKIKKGEGKNEDEIIRTRSDSENETSSSASIKSTSSPILDIATCDGPVQFERVSNPNFALTVEHHQKSTKPSASSTTMFDETLDQNSKSYLCIYCNQSFKSLFCYQKHKKRHLNPVSVDITSTIKEINPTLPDSVHTKDLNVQFFPCKKCGSKFPSYYFVHKHKKLCDKQLYSN